MGDITRQQWETLLDITMDITRQRAGRGRVITAATGGGRHQPRVIPHVARAIIISNTADGG